MPIGTTNYPSSLDTQSTLVEARNNASTTLTVALPSTTNANPTLTLSVVSTASFPPTGIFRINNELFSYDSKNDTNNTFNVIARQFESSPLESHSSGDTVSLDITAASNNVKNSAIIAVETKLGVGSSTPTNGTVLKGTGSGTSGWGSITLGTDTDGNYVSNVTGSGGVTVTHTAGEGSTAAVSLNPAASPSFAGLTATGGVTANNVRVGITANNEIDTSSGNLILDSTGGTVTVDDNLTVSGNFTVNGTTTIINSNTLEIGDNLIILNSDFTGSPTENAGIEIERGDSANTLLRWNESNDKWELTNDGNIYGNIVTTSDSGTVTSSMIQNGTIVDADISSSAAINLSKLTSGSPAQVPIVDSLGVLTYRSITGAISIDNTGVTSITDDSIALGTKTTGNYVATISGTANQVIVSGSGSETAAVTLSLPQNIGTSSTPTFSGITVGQVNSSSNLTLSTASGGNILLTPSGNVSITGNVNIGGTSSTLTINGLSSSLVVKNDSGGNGIVIRGGSGGTNHNTTLTTGSINTNYTLTLPSANGTLISTGDTATVTGTMIANSTVTNANLVSSTISGVSLGGNLNNLTIGNGLSGTSYNGSSAVTIQINTATTVDINTPQTLSNKTLASPILTTPNLGTPSSGNLVNCSGLLISGLSTTFSDSLGLGTIELGNSSDTTISRLSSGVIAVEGVEVVTISRAQTLSNKTLTSPTFSGAITSDTSTASSAGYLGVPVTTYTGVQTVQVATSDFGKIICLTTISSGTFVVNIPVNSYPIGTAFTVINDSESSSVVFNITSSSDVIALAGTTLTGTRTLGHKGVATILKLTSSRWIITGSGIS